MLGHTTLATQELLRASSSEVRGASAEASKELAHISSWFA